MALHTSKYEATPEKKRKTTKNLILFRIFLLIVFECPNIQRVRPLRSMNGLRKREVRIDVLLLRRCRPHGGARGNTVRSTDARLKSPPVQHPAALRAKKDTTKDSL